MTKSVRPLVTRRAGSDLYLQRGIGTRIGANRAKVRERAASGSLRQTTAKLDLDGQVLKVKTAWHAYPAAQVVNAGKWIAGKKPGYANILWLTPGLKILFY